MQVRMLLDAMGPAGPLLRKSTYDLSESLARELVGAGRAEFAAAARQVSNAVGFTPGEADGLRAAQSGQLPVYLYGDSFLCKGTRNLFPSAGTLSLSAMTLTGFLPVTFSPPGRRFRLGGFVDSRLNCVGLLRASGGAMVIDLPVADLAGANTSLIANAQDGSQSIFGDELDWPTDYGLVTHAGMYAGKQYVWENLAVGGSTPQNLSDKLETNFAGRAPGVVLLEHSVNVGKNGIVPAAAKALYRSMAQRLLALGHKVILTTPTTFTSAYAGYAAVNGDLLRNAADTRSLAQEMGVRILDLCELALNKTSADGQPQTAFVDSDGIHWMPMFLATIAPQVAAALDAAGAQFIPAPKLLSTWDCRYTSAGAAHNASSSNVLKNGQLFGSAGAVPTGWSATNTGSPTIVHTKSASELSGSDGTWQIDYTGASGTNVLWKSPSFHADLAAGMTITFGGDMVLPADLAAGRIAVGILATVDGIANCQLSINQFAVAAKKAGTYRLFSKPYTIPVGSVVTDAVGFIQMIPGSGGWTNALAQFRQFRVDAMAA